MERRILIDSEEQFEDIFTEIYIIMDGGYILEDSEIGRAHPELVHKSPFTSFIKDESKESAECEKYYKIINECTNNLYEKMIPKEDLEDSDVFCLCNAYEQLRVNFCRKIFYYGYMLGKGIFNRK